GDFSQGYHADWNEFNFAPVEAKYVRIVGHSFDKDVRKNSNLVVHEIELYKKLLTPIPSSIEYTNSNNEITGHDNALYLVWEQDKDLQRRFANPINNLALVEWAQTEGYKHYSNLAEYAPTSLDEVLPGLWQIYDDDRDLQDKFRKNGGKSDDLIEYARNKGYAMDSRLYDYAPYATSNTQASFNTFETHLDQLGNPSTIISRDEKGSRTLRQYDAEGRLIVSKDELMLLWEQDPKLYMNHRNGDSLTSWAKNEGFKISKYADGLWKYNPTVIGEQSNEKPLTAFNTYEYSDQGYLSKTKSIQTNLEGNQYNFQETEFNSLGDETLFRTDSGSYEYTSYRDVNGRMVRQKGSGGGYGSSDNYLAVNADSSNLSNKQLQSTLTTYFVLMNHRLPTPEEVAQQIDLIKKEGRYLTQIPYTLNRDQDALLGSQTITGAIEGPSSQNSSGFSYTSWLKYIKTSFQFKSLQTVKELSTINDQNSNLASLRDTAEESENILENKYLGVITQGVFRKLLGRDADIEGENSELRSMTQRLRELGQTTDFETFIKNEYQKDANGITEYTRRQSDVQGVINEVDQALRIYFGLESGTLDAKLKDILKSLLSDSAFNIEHRTAEELDEIKRRLEALKAEDIHFGSSAIYALHGFLGTRISTPNQLTLLKQVLFTDILTGVISKNFVGNLQFSAYALKTVANIHSVQTQGLNLSIDQLIVLLEAQGEVVVNIEERHFILLTGISGDVVSFKENGQSKTMTLTEFKARWFGFALTQAGTIVETDSKTHTTIQFGSHTLIVKNQDLLNTEELLKVKGAGWFKKLFKKIARVFQNIAKAISKVLMKITASITKFLTKALGETVGGFLAGMITGPLNSLATTAYYIGEGDFKGLVKHMGQMLLQAAIQIAVFLVLGPILQAVGSFLSTAGTAAINFGTNLAAQAGSAIGQFVGNAIATVGTVIQNIGNGLVKFAKVLQKKSSGGIDGFVGDTASNFANSLNPLTSYANTFSNATTSFATGGLEKLLIDSAVRIGQKFAQYKVEQKIQESKLSSFYKTVLSSVSNTTIDGLAYSLSPSTYPEYQKILDQSDVNKNSPPLNENATPVNKPSFATRFLTGLRNAGTAISNVLKGASGFIKSIFISPDSKASPEDQLRFAIDQNGEIESLTLKEGNANIDQTTQTKNGITTTQIDGGDLIETKMNAETGEVDYYAEIGGLKADESSVDSLLRDDLEQFYQASGFARATNVPAASSYLRQRLGRNRKPVTIGDSSAAREFINAYGKDRLADLGDVAGIKFIHGFGTPKLKLNPLIGEFSAGAGLFQEIGYDGPKRYVSETKLEAKLSYKVGEVQAGFAFELKAPNQNILFADLKAASFDNIVGLKHNNIGSKVNIKEGMQNGRWSMLISATRNIKFGAELVAPTAIIPGYSAGGGAHFSISEGADFVLGFFFIDIMGDDTNSAYVKQWHRRPRGQ
ncbi:MAG: hypothetical protein ACI9CF_001998, partial [Candidatus Omnitrophota bacterium]